MGITAVQTGSGWDVDGLTTVPMTYDAATNTITDPTAIAALQAVPGLGGNSAIRAVLNSRETFDVAMSVAPTVTTSATQTISGGTYLRWDSTRVSVNGAMQMSGASPYGEFKRVDNGYPGWAGGANVRDVGGPCAAWIETDSQDIEINVLEFQTGQILILVDDEFVSLTPTSTGSSFANRFIKLAFADRELRKIRVEFFGCLFGGFVINANATALLRPTTGPRVHIVGDSYVQISGGGNLASTSKSLAHQISRRLGFDNIWPNGAGERGYLQGVADGNAPNLLDRMDTDILPILQDGDLVVNLNGFNDRAFSATQMGDAVSTFIYRIKGENKNVHVAVATPFRPRPEAGGNFAIPTGHDEAIANAAAAGGATAFTLSDLYTGAGYNGSGTGNSALYIGADTIHPNDVGYSYTATAVVRKLKAALLLTVGT